MTLVGLEYLKQQETQRSNRMNEALQSRKIAQDYQIAAENRAATAHIASLDRQSREDVNKYNVQQQNTRATDDRNFQYFKTQIEQDTKQRIAEADREFQKQKTAKELEQKALDREANVRIADLKRNAERQMAHEKNFFNLVPSIIDAFVPG